MSKTMETSQNNYIEGLIIRLIDYKESSYIMHLLTPKGIESIICKGVKKLNSKYKGYILSYNYVKCFISNGKIPILTDILVIDTYSNICNDINKNMFAGKLINMLYKEKYENDKVYDLALKSIKFINDSSEDYYYYLFLLKNLYFIGLGLNFSNIKESFVGYNISESRLVLKNDSIAYDIDKERTITLYNLYYSKLEDKLDIDLSMLINFLKKYYELHASIKL